MRNQTLRCSSSLVVLSLLCSVAAIPARAQNGANSRGQEWFAAIAVSETQKRFGMANWQPSRPQAQAVAIGNTGASDGRMVACSKNGWFCALVYESRGNAHGGGYGSTVQDAVKMAFEECQTRTIGQLDPASCDALWLQAMPPQEDDTPSPPPTAGQNIVVDEVYRQNPMFMPIFGRTYSNQPGFWYSKRDPGYNPTWGRTYSNRPQPTK